MEHSETLDKLATALAKAQASIQAAHKSAENPFFNSKYADMAACWDACREPLSKEGLSVVQMPSTGDGEVLVTTLLLHSSGQWIKEVMSCKPAKNDAQAMGSVTTYLRRYMLMGAAGIAPSDDDGNAATKGGDKSAEQMTPTERKKAGLWKGPLQITALKNKLRDLAAALDECTSQECVTDLTEEYAEVLSQASEDLPDWYEKAEVKIQEVLTVTKDGEPAEPVSDYLVPVALSDGHADWNAWRQQVENLIDTAPTLETVNEIAEANQPAFGNFTKAQKDNAAALKKIIENKRGFFAQAPA